MTMRVFLSAPAHVGHRIALDPDEVHYLLRVRRARRGDALELLDGRALFRGTLVEASARAATVVVEAELPTPEELPLELALCIPETTAALEAIVGATELGVTRITWVRSTHSHGKPPTAARIERVLRSAMRQCGRPTAPEVAGPVPLADLLDETSCLPRFIAAEQMRGKASAVPSAPEGALLLVGPEGGFHPAETQAASAAGWAMLGLGPWTLRTPTAVVAGLSRLIALRQDAHQPLGARTS